MKLKKEVWNALKELPHINEVSQRISNSGHGLQHHLVLHPPSEHGKNFSFTSHPPSTLHTNVFCGPAYPKAMQSKAFWEIQF